MNEPEPLRWVNFPASPEQIEAARDQYQCDEIEIDDDARLSDPQNGEGYWVQGWLWVDTYEEEEDNPD